MRTRIAALCLSVPLAALGAGEDYDDPKAEQGAFTVAPGWTVELVAREPAVVNPIQMDFDAKGRLWVVCAPGYPHHYSSDTPNDYVVVLEDKDGDGVRETSTVFASGLKIPTGIAVGYGGIFLGDGRDLVHLVDTDGDGKADRRNVVASGFGLEDTHHTIHTFRWGADGRLYFHQGLWINSHVETTFGPRSLDLGGSWRLHVPSGRLDVYDRSLKQANQWGHALDAWGDDIITAAWTNGVFDIVWPLSAGGERYRASMQVGSGRLCGADVLSGGHVGDEYQGALVSALFLQNQSVGYAMSEQGSALAAKQQWQFIVSKDRRYRPIDVRVGPDGAVYIADLYQLIIQHIQVKFTDPRRDHRHGRIWRLKREGRPLLTPPKLDGAPVATLLARLADAENWNRQMARRLLAERPRAEVLAAVERWLPGLGTDEAAERTRVEGLWVLAAHDEPRRDLIERLLKSPVPRARAAALRVVGLFVDRIQDPLALLAIGAKDEHARVRLRAALAAMQIADLRSAQLIADIASKPRDPLLDATIKEGFVRLKPLWEPALAAGTFRFPDAEVQALAQGADKDPPAPKKK